MDFNHSIVLVRNVCVADFAHAKEKRVASSIAVNKPKLNVCGERQRWLSAPKIETKRKINQISYNNKASLAQKTKIREMRKKIID